MDNSTNVTQALNLCKALHARLEPHGYYPALTGGHLYKGGSRKDIDIVIYRNRQAHSAFEMRDVEEHLGAAGLTGFSYYGFVTKCMYGPLVVDLLNPETKDLSEADYEALSQGGVLAKPEGLFI